MITGLCVSVAGPEVRKLAEARAARLDEKAKKIEALVVQPKQEYEAPFSMGSTLPSHDAYYKFVQQQEKLAGYRKDASELDFVAKHIDDAELYILSHDDLKRLGIAR